MSTTVVQSIIRSMSGFQVIRTSECKANCRRPWWRQQKSTDHHERCRINTQLAGLFEQQVELFTEIRGVIAANLADPLNADHDRCANLQAQIDLTLAEITRLSARRASTGRAA